MDARILFAVVVGLIFVVPGSILADWQSDLERRLHAEVTAVLAGRTPTVDDLPSLPYVRMVIEEAMRIYPPTWMVAREAIAGDVIGGYTIPAGSMIIMSPYVTHRHPDFWERR